MTSMSVIGQERCSQNRDRLDFVRIELDCLVALVGSAMPRTFSNNRKLRSPAWIVLGITKSSR